MTVIVIAFATFIIARLIEKSIDNPKYLMCLLNFNKLNIKVLEPVKAHIQTNKISHPTLVAVGISVALTAVVVGIFYMADSSRSDIFGPEETKSKNTPITVGIFSIADSDMFGQEEAEAKSKTKSAGSSRSASQG